MRNSTPCAWPGLWIMVSTSPGPLRGDWGSRRVQGGLIGAGGGSGCHPTAVGCMEQLPCSLDSHRRAG